MTPTSERIKAHCNNCGGTKNHDALHTEIETQSDDNWWAYFTYKLIKCAGCDNIHLRHEIEMSNITDEEGNQIVKISYFPPATSRRKPEWTTGLVAALWFNRTNIGELLDEIYISLQNGSLRLAAMGVRAVLELIMIEQIGGDTGTFGGNIERFFALGFVAPHQQPLFRNALIEAGHAAMHRGYKPTEVHLSALLDMTEGLIASIYVHPMRVSELPGSFPARMPRAK